MPVFQRKDRGRGTKRWVAQVEWRDPLTGQRRYKQTYHLTKAEAEDDEARMRADVVKGKRPGVGEPRLAEFVPRWLAGIRSEVEAKTFVEYERYATRVLVPAFGQKKLGQVTRAHVRALLTDLGEQGRSLRYREMVRAVGSRLYNDAADPYGLVTENPFAGQRLGKRGERKKRAKLVMWTVEQLRDFLDAVKTDPDRIYFLFKILTGARQGELFAMRPEDVDLRAGTVRIGRSVTRVQGIGFDEKAPKSEDGWRTVPLHPAGVLGYRVQLELVDAWRTLAGAAWTEKGLLFPNRTGGFRDGQLLRKKLRVVCVRLGLPLLTEHQLRHLHAALLILLNVHPKVIQEQLGHADIRTTMDLYGHLMPGVGSGEVKRIGELLGG